VIQTRGIEQIDDPIPLHASVRHDVRDAHREMIRVPAAFVRFKADHVSTVRHGDGVGEDDGETGQTTHAEEIGRLCLQRCLAQEQKEGGE
jgi:hypothetical protein